MFQDAQQSWIEVFRDGDAALKVNHRLLLKAHGSEFAYRRVYEPRREAVASDLAETTLLGADVTAAQLSAGSRKLLVPNHEVLVVEELNYKLEEASGGTVTSDMEAGTLEVLVNGQTDARLPKFTLGNYARGANGLNFGTLALGWILPPRALLSIKYAGGGAGGDSLNLYLSLTVRHEPLWLMQAAGLVLQGNPRP